MLELHDLLAWSSETHDASIWPCGWGHRAAWPCCRSPGPSEVASAAEQALGGHFGAFALILDGNTTAWEARPDWAAKARVMKGGWSPKYRANLLVERRRAAIKPLVR